MMPSKPCCLYARPARVDLLHSPGACVRMGQRLYRYHARRLSWVPISPQSRRSRQKSFGALSESVCCCVLSVLRLR